MDLHLLGPIEARLDGRPIALGARKQRAVLAMLALQVGRTVSADRLSEGLWGERAPPSAGKMLQLYVSHLRRLLDGGGAEIHTRGRGYELRLTDGEVDAVRFERLLDESRPREALALWRGDPLADVADEPFAAAEIRRLDELRLHAAEAAIAADLAAGLHADVVAELDALVAGNPLRERLQAQRMLALYRSGRQAEALEAFRDARGALVEQVGIEPGPELQSLQRAILAQDPALDLPVAAPESAMRAAPAHRRGRGPPVLAGAAALLALAVLAAFGVDRALRPDRLARIDEGHVGVIDPGEGRITTQYAVGKGAAAIVAGQGSIWVANALDGTVSRIDRHRGQTVIDVGGEPSALAFGGDALWVANGRARSVAQVDPGTNKVVERIEVGNASRGVAVGFGALWVASAVDGTVRRIDLGSGRIRAIPMGVSPTALAAGAGAVWVASEEAGTVTRLDPGTGAVAKAINVGNGPSAVAVGAGAVWVVNRPDGTVSRIDPRRMAVTWATGVGADPVAITAADGGVWVAGGEAVTHVDPGLQRVVGRIPVGGGTSAIAVADGAVWTSAVPDPGGHAGGTLRVISPVGAPVAVPVDWLEPAGYGAPTAQIVSLAYDGLVAYRRIEGAVGATVVGALAEDAPAPSPDGRSYVFRLRPGLRFSDGRAVRPEDFRASMERYLTVTRDEGYPPTYAAIVGVRRCMAEAGRCDLSAGIETDPGARTITVHLTRPDAEFLHKLTFQWAYVVPADTPRRRLGNRAPAGTGPYRIAAWQARRGGELVRNPHFRAWSAHDRPKGYADRIVVRVRDPRAIPAQVADVGRGAADLTVVANQFQLMLPHARLRGLELRSPGAPTATRRRS